jgi:hypothetical protein
VICACKLEDGRRGNEDARGRTPEDLRVRGREGEQSRARPAGFAGRAWGLRLRAQGDGSDYCLPWVHLSVTHNRPKVSVPKKTIRSLEKCKELLVLGVELRPLRRINIFGRISPKFQYFFRFRYTPGKEISVLFAIFCFQI